MVTIFSRMTPKEIPSIDQVKLSAKFDQDPHITFPYTVSNKLVTNTQTNKRTSWVSTVLLLLGPFWKTRWLLWLIFSFFFSIDFLLKSSEIPAAKPVFTFQLIHFHCRFPLEGISQQCIVDKLHHPYYYLFSPGRKKTDIDLKELWIWPPAAMRWLPVLTSQFLHVHCDSFRIFAVTCILNKV